MISSRLSLAAPHFIDFVHISSNDLELNYFVDVAVADCQQGKNKRNKNAENHIFPSHRSGQAIRLEILYLFRKISFHYFT